MKKGLQKVGPAIIVGLLLPGCAPRSNGVSSAGSAATLTEARRGFQTKLLPTKSSKQPIDVPPAGTFTIVKYKAPGGEYPAYLSVPASSKKGPAIIWITGGDCNSIGDVWSPSPPSDDQTAAAYRKAGIVMLFPSLRGGNDNPGTKEGFLGEVDDVLAATDYLKSHPAVDPKRVYLGGHSTGGTLAMLVAQSSPQYRGVFAFGPVEDVAGYGQDSGFLPFDIRVKKEVELRSPGYWLHSIQSPIWVIEGTEGNIESLRAMAKINTNSKAKFLEVAGADHFATMAPVNEIIAQKILKDTGTTSNIEISAEEVSRPFAR